MQHVNLSSAGFRVHLQNEFSRRCRVNSRYSLRSFARQIGIEASSVSQILSGKRKVSDKLIARICQKIGWPQAAQTLDGYALMSADVVSAISDWYHYAILELVQLKTFRNDPAWISKKLGIGKIEAQNAVARLLRLEMLTAKNGRIKKTQANYSNYARGQTSESHKEFQRQIVRKSLEAIDLCPQECKDVTCITIAANSAKLEEARERIKNFRRDLCAFMEDGAGDSVYALAVQLIPLTTQEET